MTFIPRFKSPRRGGYIQRKARLPRKSKTRRGFAGLEFELEDACKRAVFARDGYACVRCGWKCEAAFDLKSGMISAPGLQWAHIHTRGAASLKYTPENTLTLCAGCHLWLDGNSPPYVPHPKREWWAVLYPERDRMLTLHLQTTHKVDWRAHLLYLRSLVP